MQIYRNIFSFKIIVAPNNKKYIHIVDINDINLYYLTPTLNANNMCYLPMNFLANLALYVQEPIDNINPGNLMWEVKLVNFCSFCKHHYKL